ncbi:hypothetical protein N7494_009846 [Penicillium frequentans]|uniref:Uncharacterized protein n=1 Tax=Penicillium frequentans TaxID=3151616 RepID=A0AAD6CSF0_9EURO|nr:hypothetical protein N7494_009846 [Penicillium glabrum]
MLLRHPIFSYISVVLPLQRSSLASVRRINSKAQDQQTSIYTPIYRCSYKNESAWSRLLQRLREQIESDLEYD